MAKSRRDASESDVVGRLSESGAFEVTDLGDCSFLDDPKLAQVPSPVPVPASLSENVKAVVDGGAPAREEANAVSRSVVPKTPRGTTGLSGSARQAAERRGRVPDPGAAPTVVRGWRGDEQSPPERLTPGSSSVEGADRLDAALADFAGTAGVRSAAKDLQAIYGGVFDPDAREEAARAATQELLASGSSRPVTASPESAFAWDDADLDRPIDAEEVRRRVGRRVDGVPQAMILRRRRSSETSSDSRLP